MLLAAADAVARRTAELMGDATATRSGPAPRTARAMSDIEHDPRWRLGQCIVWLATCDDAVVHGMQRYGVASILAALPLEEVSGPPTKEGNFPLSKSPFDRCWMSLVAEFYHGRLTASAEPSNESGSRDIKQGEWGDPKLSSPVLMASRVSGATVLPLAT